MADRTCPSCGKTFKKPCLLRSHLRRKTPCAPIVQKEELPATEQAKLHACKFCGRRFTSLSGKSTHVRSTCKIANSKDGLDRLAEYTEKRQFEKQNENIAMLTEQVAKLTALIEGKPDTPAIGNQTNIAGNQTTVTNYITLKFFGQESTNHINAASIKALLHTLSSDLPAICGQRLPEGETHEPPVQRKIDAIAKEVLRVMLTDIYANPHHPENLTTYIPNKKENQIMVWGEHEPSEAPVWQLQPLEIIVPEIQTKVLDLINKHQPWEGPTREKFREYGILIRGAYDCDRDALSRLIKSAVTGNKALLTSLGREL